MSNEEKKAKELIEKFYQLNRKTDTCFGICEDQPANICDHTGHGCGLQVIHAKQCALICVDEIMNEFPQGIENSFERKRYNYWQQVKQQIQIHE